MPTKEQKPKGRIKQLLLKCAENLDNGCEAMHHEFLVENSVSADECFTLGQQMAVAVRGYANAPSELAAKILICSEFKDQSEREYVLANMDRASAQKKALEALKKL